MKRSFVTLLPMFVSPLSHGCKATAETQALAGEHHQHGARQHGAAHHRFDNAQKWASHFDDPSRDEWQRPEEIMKALDLTPEMTVADIGAGTGYFAMRLARALTHGKVVATDIEPDMVRYLTSRAEEANVKNLSSVLSTEASTGLEPMSCDRVLIVNVWHHIDDRKSFAARLASALRRGGKVLIVEFNSTARRGPPERMRLASATVIDELKAAGFAAQLRTVGLPDQYAVEAWLANDNEAWLANDNEASRSRHSPSSQP